MIHFSANKQISTLSIAIFFLLGCAWSANKPNDDTTDKQSSVAKGEVKKEIKKISKIEDTVSVAYLMGKFDPAKHPDFARIEAKYTDKKEAYLRKEAYKSFVAMAEAAAKAGVKLRILSATRNFDRQKKIWEDKWKGLTKVEDGTSAAKIKDPVKRAQKILLYSSMPGSSRHHWGTDVDFNYLSDDYFTHGQGKKIYTWLVENAASYGFCQPYSNKNNGRTGYNEEKWHWSYMPLSAPFTKAAKTKMTNEQVVGGFQGSEAAVGIDIVKNYVLGISTLCFEE